MKLALHQSRPLSGDCLLPGDKSISHRVALIASLAEGESRIENFLDAGVTRAMLKALRALDVAWELDGSTLTLQGRGPGELRSPEETLDCGSSATTMRLLAGALAGANVPCVLDGSAGLRARPMGRIIKPLQAMGVPIKAADGDVAPLVLSRRTPGAPLRAISVSLPVASAQVKSALLLAALGAQGRTRLEEPGPSRDHTERLLASMGVGIERAPMDNRVILEAPTRPLPPLRFRLPGDISSGAFIICAALIVPGSMVIIREVGLNPTRTGFLDAVRAMGAKIDVKVKKEVNGEPLGDIVAQASRLHGIRIEGPLVVRMIDEFPIFAIVAALAEGETIVREAEELRYKESDRIAVMCEELHAIGVEIQAQPDGFRICGGRRLKGGVRVNSHGDHRLAMALCVAGLMAEDPIVVENADVITQSFPGFADCLESLGAKVTVCV